MAVINPPEKKLAKRTSVQRVGLKAEMETQPLRQFRPKRMQKILTLNDFSALSNIKVQLYFI